MALGLGFALIAVIEISLSIVQNARSLYNMTKNKEIAEVSLFLQIKCLKVLFFISVFYDYNKDIFKEYLLIVFKLMS